MIFVFLVTCLYDMIWKAKNSFRRTAAKFKPNILYVNTIRFENMLLLTSSVTA